VFAYIWLRFAWQFAVGAIVAILHDIILTLGLFVLTAWSSTSSALRRS